MRKSRLEAIREAEILIAKEKIKQHKYISPLKTAFLFGLVLGLFVTIITAFRSPHFQKVNETTKIIGYGFPLPFREWQETRCPGKIFKVCERGETTYSPLNFLVDWVILGGITFLITYIMVAWNIKGPPWRYYSRFD